MSTGAERDRLFVNTAMEAADQTWVEEWTKGDPPTDEESIAWIRSRPPVIQSLLRRFPPSCLVIATVLLHIPRRGTRGIVTSLFEDGKTVTVRQAPASELRAQCSVDELVVVGYHRGMTPDWVAKVLA